MHKKSVFKNTHIDNAKMIALQAGTSNTGKWQTEEVNILRDYQMAFGEKPASTVSIAIMNDSDNTEEDSISYVDFIEFFRKP